MGRALWVVPLILLGAVAVSAGGKSPVGVGSLFYDGGVVRTRVPPAAAPKTGVDALYVVSAGTAGQLPVAAVAPGDRDYHGGKWAFHLVTWNVLPYLLTSESEVMAAAAASDVMITRVPANDFKCPIQP
jgi:hypothetical protein